MKAIARTDTGKVRASNQDSYLMETGVYAIADGMGGHNGGETASALAVQVIRKLLPGKEPDRKILELGVSAANRRIYETGREDAALQGMGTTLSLMWEGKDSLWIAHVGDSRIYRLRCGAFEQLTEDHSMVGEMLRNKLLTPQQARKHPYRNIITRAVGTDAVVMPDLFLAEKLPGDLFLICSDGLYNMVSDEEILQILQESDSDETAADTLLQTALEHGGADNVTLILCRAEEVCEA